MVNHTTAQVSTQARVSYCKCHCTLGLKKSTPYPMVDVACYSLLWLILAGATQLLLALYLPGRARRNCCSAASQPLHKARRGECVGHQRMPLPLIH